jgi:hypothetical protein
MWWPFKCKYLVHVSGKDTPVYISSAQSIILRTMAIWGNYNITKNHFTHETESP